MAVVMLAGGKAMKGMFGVDETVTILALAVLAGSYTIYGGLISVAWTDFLQFIVMMIGGLVVAICRTAPGRAASTNSCWRRRRSSRWFTRSRTRTGPGLAS